MFEFEYGDNEELKENVKKWSAPLACGGYILCGDSATGKTTLLAKFKSSKEFSTYLSMEYLIDALRNAWRDSIPPTLDVDDNTRVVIIESLDELRGKEATTTLVCDYIADKMYVTNDGRKRLIICTTTDMKQAEEISSRLNFEIIYIKPVKPTKQIVKKTVQKMGLRLTEIQLRELESLDSMLKLKNAVTKLYFIQERSK